MTDKPTPIKATVNVVNVETVERPGKKTYVKVTTDRDGTFSVWDRKLWDKIPNRGNCAIEWLANLDFKNIVGVSASQPTPTPSTGSTTYADREYLITRQTALKAAVDSLKEGINIDIPTILGRAQAFHEWILRDPSNPF